MVKMAILIWVGAAVFVVWRLMYYWNHARQVRKWLRQDYGYECCRLLSNKEAPEQDRNNKPDDASGLREEGEGAA